MNPPPERTILETRPSWAFVILRRSGLLVACTLLGLLGVLMILGQVLPEAGLWAGLLGLAGGLLVMICNRIERDGEVYVLTTSRAVQRSRFIRRFETEAPIARLQHAVLYQSLPERLLGVGTVGMATAGSDTIEIVWWMMERPREVLAQVRAAMTGAHDGNNQHPAGAAAAMVKPVSSQRPIPPSGPPVIGLAGGIGSGKSTIARELGALGCLVIDSDQRARAALDRPDVRATLAEWWGSGILAADGRVDRSKVAAIVFANPEQRARLEGLVHPIVRQDRAAMIAEAERTPEHAYSAVVIDAPLLFEAGLDKECDAVIFVDTPRAARLARVAATRGWSEDELQRREAAQLDLAEKRRRSSHVVDNSGNPDDLRARLAAILSEIRARRIG